MTVGTLPRNSSFIEIKQNKFLTVKYNIIYLYYTHNVMTHLTVISNRYVEHLWDYLHLVG